MLVRNRRTAVAAWLTMTLIPTHAFAKYSPCDGNGAHFLQPLGTVPRNAKLWWGEINQLPILSFEVNAIASTTVEDTLAHLVDNDNEALFFKLHDYELSAYPRETPANAWLPSDSLVQIKAVDFDYVIGELTTSSSIDLEAPHAPVIHSVKLRQYNSDSAERTPADDFLWDVDVPPDAVFFRLRIWAAGQSSTSGESALVWRNDLDRFGTTRCGPQIPLRVGQNTCVSLAAIDIAGNVSPAAEYCTVVTRRSEVMMRNNTPVGNFPWQSKNRTSIPSQWMLLPTMLLWAALVLSRHQRHV
jgi:hypothetical protein